MESLNSQHISWEVLMGHYYYVNKNAQSNGDHEVHVSSCDRLPEEKNRLKLGVFETCGPAVREAKKTYPRSNGCYYCSKSCHTT